MIPPVSEEHKTKSMLGEFGEERLAGDGIMFPAVTENCW